MLKNNQEREAYYREDSNWNTIAEMPNFIRLQKLENYPLVRFQIYLKNNYMGNRYHTQEVLEIEDEALTLCVKNIYNLTPNQAVAVMREHDKQK